MPSRSALERAGVALGAVVEGVWCGALAAALTDSSWVLLSVFVAAMMATAAGISRWTVATAHRERRSRVAAAALVAAGIVALLGAGQAWTHDYLFWQVVRDVVFVSGIAALGIHLGDDELTPETAVRRAIRGFALLCAVLVGVAAAGSTPGWAAPAVVSALVAGGLLIAVVRYRALTDLVAASDRLPSWPWLLAVTGTILCVVAVAALLGKLLDVDVLHWMLSVLVAVSSAALDGVAYAIGWAGAGLLRALEWVLGLIHLRAPHLELKPPALRARVTVPSYRPAAPASSATRLVVTVAGTLIAAIASLAVVVFALRRLRRRTAADEAVVEEREALGSLRDAAGAVAGGLGRRLRRRLSALGRREARSPGDRVRLRYAQLEQRLAAAGRPRPLGVTVRDYLTSCERTMQVSAQVADVAGLYELARYSAHAVDEAEARRFEELTRAFRA